ncbi:hypothetical protein LCGC14_1814590 [marine sediment metagenome]|uniref:CBS domain-containing protein n=1 Tax=marine sediment metagenome TaxID=412755 RepID=A0A0F9JKC5_9ZZZZ
MTTEEERQLELLQNLADSAQQIVPFLRMRMRQARIWTPEIEETFKRYAFAHKAAHTPDEEKSAWEQMGDLNWLDYVTRNIHLVRRSGESEELRGLLDYAKEWAVPVLAITSGEGSMLARAAQVILSHGGEEACPFNLTPTSSVTAAGALGDALAMALQSYLGFSAKNFQDLHGNGTLGRRLTLKVKDVMVTWPHYIGIVRPDDSILEGMMTLARKRGTLVVIDSGETEKFLGVVTAGDVARFLDTEFRPVSSHPAAGRKEWLDLPLSTIMTRDPHVIAPGVLVVTAIELMRMEGVMALPVLDDGCVMGMIHLHDALRARVQ